MKIIHNEANPETPTKHHVFIEARDKGTSVVVDIFGRKDYAERLRVMLTETIKEFK